MSKPIVNPSPSVAKTGIGPRTLHDPPTPQGNGILVGMAGRRPAPHAPPPHRKPRCLINPAAAPLFCHRAANGPQICLNWRLFGRGSMSGTSPIPVWAARVANSSNVTDARRPSALIGTGRTAMPDRVRDAEEGGPRNSAAQTAQQTVCARDRNRCHKGIVRCARSKARALARAQKGWP